MPDPPQIQRMVGGSLQKAYENLTGCCIQAFQLTVDEGFEYSTNFAGLRGEVRKLIREGLHASFEPPVGCG